MENTHSLTKEEKQYNKMTTGSTKKLVFTLGIPTMISMLITALYNIADTLFVSKLGESVSGAVTVVFPLMAIIQAVGFTFGMGAGSLISSLLGSKKDEEAQKIGSSSFYIGITIGILIAIMTLLLIDPLMRLLGSTETVFPHARSYCEIICFGFPLMTGSFIMNNILRSEGKAKFSMIGLTTGGILNIILDPIFINTLGMEIKGAAVATVISQGVSFCILLYMFISKKSIIKLAFRYISKDIKPYLGIVKVGFPSLCRQGLASFSTILLNNSASSLGQDAALSAIGITSKIVMVIFSVCLGIGQGYQPVCGYNYFAEKKERVKEALTFTGIFGFITMFLFSLCAVIFSKQLIKIFIDSQEVIKIGSIALTLQCISMPFLVINVLCNMTYQSTRKSVLSTLLSSCRQGIFFIPFILILPSIYGLNGVLYAQPIADILTMLFSIPFLVRILKNLSNKDK